MRLIALSAAVAFAAALSPLAANAQQTGVYAGIGYTHMDTDLGDIGAATGRLGYRFHPNLAVEGEASFGVDSDTAVDLDNNVGVYALAILPVTSNFDVHGRVGWQRSEFDTPLGGTDSDGVGFGVGATFHFANNFGVRADYTRYDGDIESDGWSLGASLRF